MRFIDTQFPDVFVIEPKVFGDARGFFLESYNHKAFQDKGLDIAWVQDNHARSEAVGVLRGLHFQVPPRAQTKLVRVTAGAVLDVIVDLRKGSPTFGKWDKFELTAANFKQLLVPKGFAHGYVTLAPGTEFLYKVDDYYAPTHDAGIIWNDPDLGVEWPAAEPILSDKDRVLPRLRDFDSPFVFTG